MSLLLTDVQQVSLAIKPKSAAGNDAPVDGVPDWSSSDPSVITVSPSADGMSCDAVTTGKLGVAQVQCNADADLGAGTKPITAVLDIEVKASEAVQLAIEAGVPTDKPTP
jgi:hypothetical protein